MKREEQIKNGNDTILHDKSKESEIDRLIQFKKEKSDHWKARSEV